MIRSLLTLKPELIYSVYYSYPPFFSQEIKNVLIKDSLFSCQLRRDTLLILHRSPGSIIAYSFP